jgi:AcrR family transcriptional regulator/DNA-binding MarR family transcriptional regulator
MLDSSGVQRHDAGAPSGSGGLRSGAGVSEVLRARILSVAVALVGEVGYARMTVERVARLSGSSQETFHKYFEDLDDCLLAAFENAIGRIAAVVAPVYEREDEWPAKVRAALTALLAMIEDEPAMSTFVFVGALGAGPKVLACRMEALERLKVAFEHGIDEAGRVDGNGIDGMGRVDVSEIGESSPLSAEGAVNGVLGILHTRLLEGSPLARRPLSELAGPLTAMVVLPYVGQVAAGSSTSNGAGKSNGAGALAATTAFNGARRPGATLRPTVRPGRRTRARLSPNQRAILAALEHGAHTVREFVDVTGMTDQTVRNSVNGLEAREIVLKIKRRNRLAYVLPSNGAGSTSSNGAAASSNGHGRSGRAKRMLLGSGTRVSERAFRVLAVIDECNGRGSSPSSREIRDAAEITDSAQASKLLKHLTRLGLVENTGAARLTGKPYAWRLTTKGTELLHELEEKTAGA